MYISIFVYGWVWITYIYWRARFYYCWFWFSHLKNIFMLKQTFYIRIKIKKYLFIKKKKELNVLGICDILFFDNRILVYREEKWTFKSESSEFFLTLAHDFRISTESPDDLQWDTYSIEFLSQRKKRSWLTFMTNHCTWFTNPFQWLIISCTLRALKIINSMFFSWIFVVNLNETLFRYFTFQ